MNPNNDYRKIGMDYLAEQEETGNSAQFDKVLQQAIEQATADAESGKNEGTDGALNAATKHYLLQAYKSGSVNMSPEEFIEAASKADLGYAGPLRIQLEELNGPDEELMQQQMR